MKFIKTAGMIIPLKMLDDYLRVECGINHENHRWCVIHSIANFFIMCLSFRGMVTMASSDEYILANTHSFDLSSSIIVLAIHIYHMLYFQIDQLSLWMHHIIMTFIQLLPFFNDEDQDFLMLTDYMLFFLCGLPGMIDYHCMNLVYSGKMSKIQEKNINNYLNTYIRAPGILYGAFYVYRKYVNGEMSAFHALPSIASFVWNAQFFANSVAVSYGYNLALEH